jgi:hypothetical protein
MPWMPEVFTAPIAEARRAEDATRTNDAIASYEGILAEEPDALVRSFAGSPESTIRVSGTWTALASYAPSSPRWQAGCTSATP